jgi:hypothetical protein
MVALIDDYRVPPWRVDKSFEMLYVNRTMNTCDQSRVVQSAIDLRGCGPLTEAKTEAIEFPANVINKPRRRQVKHTQSVVPL